MQNRLTEIDNPREGNCGFYAFAIGLLHVMQTENLQGKADVTTKFLSSLSNQSKVYLAAAFNIKETTDDALKAKLVTLDIKKLSTEQWEFFNQHLRQQLYQLRLDDLKNFSDLYASIDFIDVMGIFWFFYKNKSTHDTLEHDFFRDEIFKVEMKELVDKLNQYEGLVGPLTESEKIKLVIAYFFTGRHHINISEMLKQPIGNNYLFSEASIVAQVIRQKIKNGAWATDKDFARLAIYYNIHLVIYVDRELKSYGSNESKLPVIHINRSANFPHWTTLVAAFKLQNRTPLIKDQQNVRSEVYSPKMELTVTTDKEIKEIPNRYLQRFLSTMPKMKPVSSAEQDSATVTSIAKSSGLVSTKEEFFAIKKESEIVSMLTLKEIAQIFKCYTRDNCVWRFFRLEWGHNHIDLAESIIEECEQNKKAATIASVIHLIENSFPADCNPNGAYAKCVKQVLSRYKGEEQATLTLENLLEKKARPLPVINSQRRKL